MLPRHYLGSTHKAHGSGFISGTNNTCDVLISSLVTGFCRVRRDVKPVKLDQSSPRQLFRDLRLLYVSPVDGKLFFASPLRAHHAPQVAGPGLFGNIELDAFTIYCRQYASALQIEGISGHAINHQ